jgi:SAM-dependent methyltransferase
METESLEAREFLWKGRTGPFKIDLHPGVFEPTATSVFLAEALDVSPGDVVIDAGCGSGVLSLVAARLGAARTFGCDISDAAVSCARENARLLGLQDVTEFRAGDLFQPVRDVRADVVIGDVSGIPDVIARLTGWFPGGPTGAELPVKMLEDVGECLKPGGNFYLPTGTIQAENRVLETARRVFGAVNIERVLEQEFPLPSIVGQSKAVARLLREGWLNLRQRGSRLLWRLTVWRCSP